MRDQQESKVGVIPLSDEAHASPVEVVAGRLETDLRSGLTSEEARARLAEFGRNELPPPPRRGWAVTLAVQLREPMAVLLLVAAAVSGLILGERLDAAVILAIVVLNAVIGGVQEGKATRALEALRSMETDLVRAVRDGRARQVPAAELVPGDVVLLAAGDRVPADLRLAESTSLELDESMLTGESLPVGKDEARLGEIGDPLADRPSMAFSGTLVTRGSARGIAVATGGVTALGSIAEHLRRERRATPLQEELGRLTRRLGLVTVVVAAGVFGLIVLRVGWSGEALESAFLAAVALAVAAVPEGLPTVVTVGLALGVGRMARRGAIVRRLPAVETLGSTTVLLTDKTGTLTENRVELAGVMVGGGDVLPLDELPSRIWERVTRVAALCNDAELDPPVGDPVDLALLRAVGRDRTVELAEARPRAAYLPFDSERRRMTTLHRGDAPLVLVKGAPETVLERCDRLLDDDGEERPLEDTDRERILERTDDLAAAGMRLLALADRACSSPPTDFEEAEEGLTLVGIAAMRDPVRGAAAATVEEARRAGISLVMVTGDHAGTARAVAREVGLLADGGRVVTGRELRGGLDGDALDAGVYARVDPDQKLGLVERLRGRGEVVAVTGDGVNDAPALRSADIGVAMGRTGSDVAREAADMVVTDDDLATIVTAVREGRGIYDNVRKVVDYLVAGNLSEVAVVVGGLLLFPALGVPLSPLQLLWINLLTDGLPALALGVDPPAPGLMDRPPRPRSQRLLGADRIGLLASRGLLMAATALGALAWGRFVWDWPWETARTAMFGTLVAAHLLYAFAARRPSRGLRTNPRLVGAVVAALCLQALISLWEPAGTLFDTAPLEPSAWLWVVLAGAVPVAVMLAFSGSERVPSMKRPRQGNAHHE